MESYRVSHDSLGDVKVPQDAYWGPQTQRAIENFPISGLRLPRRFIRAQGIIKWAAAKANAEVGALPENIAQAIMKAADEVISGMWDQQFVVDVYQAGAGTSQNMNANEVIAHRAQQLLGGKIGDVHLVHPNDHVNMAQSTNDTIHVAIHIAGAEAIVHDLIPAISRAEETLRTKQHLWMNVVKSGRTHLQDAVPMRLGQEIGGYVGALSYWRNALQTGVEKLYAIGLGGNAVGTGINAHPEYKQRATQHVAEKTGLPFHQPENMFTFIQNLDAVLEVSGLVRGLATAVGKIANDLRLLSSGPRTGLAELKLPAVQPGSSIMPGKVNPVMAEMMNMICYQVIGNDTTVQQAVAGAQLELNVMMPVIAYNFLHAIHILSNGLDAFTNKALKGLEADVDRITGYVEMNTALATALNPYIGYDQAAEVAKTAYREGKTVRQVVREKNLLSEEQLNEALDLERITHPQES
ncbi:class II fumarate hydratase [Sulfobacillus thermosulfidooxidans]|uniref:class II fumarate hydratase n=1 Tax=Sulfobacillus thermosulfidooxidans TaxID=28034 RepID=UPI00096BB357|nr:class II fumarate hydratase [Sulfobacillus thermosulfidooxidans]OLZ07996.1 aspartate ammonia-lyase [Sulfobacillus thermosulfidooxidans]OLZ17887.1 aspartate ammonia-lyase [Sulfobacillus thermosulfidooxidans]OLZ22381.1 aspartate ammonia-lyase [Sulfobacillus thermosulfidooxidans]